METKVNLILSLIFILILSGCYSKENAQPTRPAVYQEIDQEIEAIRIKYKNLGHSNNYIDTEKEQKNHEAMQREFCKVFVGKTFTANTTGEFGNDDSIMASSFKVRSSEKFTIVKFFTHDNSYPLLSGWFKVKFESGKEAFILVANLSVVTNPPIAVPTK
jgi:PBP1b-binding outer membrane lipoprotein LpoB